MTRDEVEMMIGWIERNPHGSSPPVYADELAELCRAWLALDGAPVVSVTCRHATFGHGDYGSQWVIGDSYNPPPIEAMQYVKYRLVPVEEGE